ncbi:MAG: 16S rRNA (adenine(1518)-N(6)/adenine(1519)-N(6))-dimethyltransferase RsmA [Actinomycetota bacterium]
MNATELRRLLDAHGVRPSRALGQNFLVDTNTAQRIVRVAGVKPGDRVVEVGPGVGSLTLALTDADASVRAIEVDRHLIPLLAEVVAGRSVEIVHADAMHVDWSDVLADHDRWVMVSNLPYNVATPVVVRALETAPVIERFCVMVQREVGERLAASVGDRQYGAVSVKVGYYAHAEVAGVVGRTVFSPRPNVDSALVRLDRRTEPPVAVADTERMFTLVRAGFSTRRKTLRNALTPLLGADAASLLQAAGIDPSARAETLGLSQWAALTQVAP